MYYTGDFSREHNLDVAFFERRISELYPIAIRKKMRLNGWKIGSRELNVGERLNFDCGFPISITGEFVFPSVGDDETLLLDVWAGGETLVKVDGKPYGEINEYHRLLKMDRFLDGEKHSITLEVVPKNLFGISNFDPRFERSNLLVFNKKILGSFLDFKLVFELFKVVEDPLRSIIHDILLKAFGFLNLRCDTGSYFNRSGEDSSMRHLLTIWNPPKFPEEFENEIDEETVASFERASKFLMEEMENLSRKFSEPLEILISGHSHIDYAWLWTIDETKRKIVRTFSNVLRLMDDYPKFRFLQSSSAIYEDLKEEAPDLFEKVRKRVIEGRWETIGGSVVEFDANLPSGESLVRQFLYGQRFFEREFGERCRVCYLPDTFGFTWSLPQLMKDAGMRYFITTKLDWNDKNRFPHRWFIWRGLDGTEVVVNLFHGKHNYNSNLKPDDLIEHMKDWKRRSPTVLHDILTFGYGDGGGGPTEEMLEYYERYDKLPGMPKLRMVNVSKEIEKLKLGDLPIWDDELYLELHRGTYTNQAKMKKMNRKMENLMYLVEFFSTLDYIDGGSYPEEEIDEAWGIILRAQFHDILPGSSIKEVYDDVLDRLEKVESRMKKILKEKLEKLIRENVDDTVSVVNPTNLELPLILKDVDLKEGNYGDLKVRRSKNGRIYCISHGGSVPPFHVEHFESSDTDFETDVEINGSSLENSMLKVGIEDGKIKIYDKLRDREIIREMTLKAVRDIPPTFEAWEISPETERIETLIPSNIEILDADPSMSALMLKYEFQGSDIEMILRIYAGFRLVDLEFDVDWHTRRNMLRLNIQTDFLTRRVRNEIAFGYIERKTTKNTSFEMARFEVPQHRWLEMGEDDHGLVIVNDSKYGFSAHHSEISLSLLRGAIYPDFFSDEGKHHFEFRLIPHDGDWKPVALRHGVSFNMMIPAIHGRIRNPMGILKELFEISENPVLSSLKKRYDSEEVVVRFYESRGERTKLNIKKGMFRSNILEDELEPAGSCEIFRPFAVRTFIYKPLK